MTEKNQDLVQMVKDGEIDGVEFLHLWASKYGFEEYFVNPPLFENTENFKCKHCGCTDSDCTQCIQAQGFPCHWVKPDLCSRCFHELNFSVDPPAEYEVQETPSIQYVICSKKGNHKISEDACINRQKVKKGCPVDCPNRL